MDVPLLQPALLLSVVPSMGSEPGQGGGEGAGLLGTVTFAKVLSSCGASGKICCLRRLQKPLNTSSLWLWIE